MAGLHPIGSDDLNRSFSFGDIISPKNIATGLAAMAVLGTAGSLGGKALGSLGKYFLGLSSHSTNLISFFGSEGITALSFSSQSPDTDFNSTFFEGVTQTALMQVGSGLLAGLGFLPAILMNSAMMLGTSLASTYARTKTIGGESNLPQNSSELGHQYLQNLAMIGAFSLLGGAAGFLIVKNRPYRGHFSELPRILGLSPKKPPSWERDFEPRINSAHGLLDTDDGYNQGFKEAVGLFHELENLRLAGIALTGQNPKKWGTCARAIEEMRTKHGDKVFGLLDRYTKHTSFNSLDEKIRVATLKKLKNLRTEAVQDGVAFGQNSEIMAQTTNRGTQLKPHEKLKPRLALLGEKPESGLSPIEKIHQNLILSFQEAPVTHKVPEVFFGQIKSRQPTLGEVSTNDPFVRLSETLYGSPTSEPPIITKSSSRRIDRKLTRILGTIHPELGRTFKTGVQQGRFKVDGKTRFGVAFYPHETTPIPYFINATLTPGNITASEIIMGSAHEIGHVVSIDTYARTKGPLEYVEPSSSEFHAYGMEGVMAGHLLGAPLPTPSQRLLRDTAFLELEMFMRQTPPPNCEATGEKWGNLLMEYGLANQADIQANPSMKNSWAIFHAQLAKSTFHSYALGQMLKARVQAHYASLSPTERTAYVDHIINKVWIRGDLSFEEMLVAYNVA